MGAKDTKFKGRTAGSWGSQDLIPAKKETWGGGGVDRSEELAGLGRGPDSLRKRALHTTRWVQKSAFTSGV